KPPAGRAPTSAIPPPPPPKRAAPPSPSSAPSSPRRCWQRCRSTRPRDGGVFENARGDSRARLRCAASMRPLLASHAVEVPAPGLLVAVVDGAPGGAQSARRLLTGETELVAHLRIEQERSDARFLGGQRAVDDQPTPAAPEQRGSLAARHVAEGEARVGERTAERRHHDLPPVHHLVEAERAIESPDGVPGQLDDGTGPGACE